MTALRSRSLAAVCLPLCLVLVGGVVAQEVQGTVDYLARMDRDGDGRINPAEYLDWMSYAFDARDLDHDGVLSAAEQPGGRGQPITRAQHRQRLGERFHKQDVDGDGFLSARELAAPPL